MRINQGRQSNVRAFVDIAGGHRLFVRDWGEGQPVLFLAGWAMHSGLWGATMSLLGGGGTRTIAYDRRGHGRSTDPGSIDYDLLADDLAAVIDALDLRDVVIVAHSGAGGEAIRYVSRYGAGRVERLILVGATGPCMITGGDNGFGLPSGAVDAVLDQIRGDLPAWLDANAEPFAPGASRRTLDWLAGMVLETSRRIVIDFQRVIAAADLRAEATALQLPVTIIHGTQDASAPIGLTAERYHALIPNSELIVYDGAAHGIMVTHAERLADDIAARVALDANEIMEV